MIIRACSISDPDFPAKSYDLIHLQQFLTLADRETKGQYT